MTTSKIKYIRIIYKNLSDSGGRFQAHDGGAPSHSIQKAKDREMGIEIEEVGVF